MTTRSGANYNPMENPNSGGNPTSTSNPSPLEDMMREMLRDMRRYNDQQGMPQNELSMLDSSPPPMSTKAYNYPKFNEQQFRNVSVEAPSFDGYPSPDKFLDWVEDMDKYFDFHYDWSDEKRVRYAKMKLSGKAKTYWNKQENLLGRYGRITMITWNEMKECLKDEYVPISYRQRLLYQWEQLIQRNRLVTEYIEEFDWYLSRCNIPEADSILISRFTSGLKDEFQEELLSQRVHTLQQAYHLAQDIEYYDRTTLGRNDSSHWSHPLPEPITSQPS